MSPRRLPKRIGRPEHPTSSSSTLSVDWCIVGSSTPVVPGRIRLFRVETCVRRATRSWRGKKLRPSRRPASAATSSGSRETARRGSAEASEDLKGTVFINGALHQRSKQRRHRAYSPVASNCLQPGAIGRDGANSGSSSAYEPVRRSLALARLDRVHGLDKRSPP